MSNQNSEQTLSELFKTTRAIRFAMIAILFGLSYVNIRFSFNIGSFAEMFAGMGVKLPIVTSFIVTARPLLMLSSVLVPLAALISCWDRNVTRSFYIIGSLTILVIVELILIFHGLFAPLFQMLGNMSGASH